MKRPLTKLGGQALAALGALGFLLGGGTIAYHLMEGWSWISSFYFCVVTLTTVGYGDLTPTSDATRLFTALYLLFGAAAALAALGLIGSTYLERRGAKLDARREEHNNGKNGGP